MAVFEVTSRVTLRSLMNKTKYELAHQVLELMDLHDRERARSKVDSDAFVEATADVIGRFATIAAENDRLAGLADAALANGPRTRDADLPACGSFHG